MKGNTSGPVLFLFPLLTVIHSWGPERVPLHFQYKDLHEFFSSLNLVSNNTQISPSAFRKDDKQSHIMTFAAHTLKPVLSGSVLDPFSYRLQCWYKIYPLKEEITWLQQKENARTFLSSKVRPGKM